MLINPVAVEKVGFSEKGGGLNGSAQHSARTHLALKTKGKSAG
jgi:hypothetical protein